jgi:hypothetical protein
MRLPVAYRQLSRNTRDLGRERSFDRGDRGADPRPALRVRREMAGEGVGLDPIRVTADDRDVSALCGQSTVSTDDRSAVSDAGSEIGRWAGDVQEERDGIRVRRRAFSDPTVGRWGTLTDGSK